MVKLAKHAHKAISVWVHRNGYVGTRTKEWNLKYLVRLPYFSTWYSKIQRCLIKMIVYIPKLDCLNIFYYWTLFWNSALSTKFPSKSTFIISILSIICFRLPWFKFEPVLTIMLDKHLTQEIWFNLVMIMIYYIWKSK